MCVHTHVHFASLSLSLFVHTCVSLSLSLYICVYLRVFVYMCGIRPIHCCYSMTDIPRVAVTYIVATVCQCSSNGCSLRRIYMCVCLCEHAFCTYVCRHVRIDCVLAPPYLLPTLLSVHIE